MEKRNVNTNLVAALLVVIAVLGYGLIGKAGNLEPSAAPAPTMKTLDEVEPGTPISSVPYTIASSGSYYLSANAETTSSMFSGITIWSDNVTLDLKGFSLIGDGTDGLHGVVIGGDYKNITIRNGTITNWGGNGVEAATATKCRVEDLQVIDNAGSGIYLPGNEQRVTNCVASDNGDSAGGDVFGIYVGRGSAITGNTVNGNGHSATGTYVYGIHASTGSTVIGNTAYENGISAASYVYGIFAYEGSTVTGNTAYHNATSATGTHVYGIGTGYGSTVTGNTAFGNGCSATFNVWGIRLSGYNLVDQNTAYGNGTGAAGATNMNLGVGGCVYGINVAP